METDLDVIIIQTLETTPVWLLWGGGLEKHDDGDSLLHIYISNTFSAQLMSDH